MENTLNAIHEHRADMDSIVRLTRQLQQSAYYLGLRELAKDLKHIAATIERSTDQVVNTFTLDLKNNLEQDQKAIAENILAMFEKPAN